jgi:integrase
VQAIPGGLPADVPDSLAAWATRYLALAVVGVRSPAVTQKIALHLDRFIAFFNESYDHERISTCLRRDVLAWQRALTDHGLAPATVNNHLASLSAFTWVAAQAPAGFPVGDPAKGIRELGLPPLEPRALSPAQVRSLKNLCDPWSFSTASRASAGRAAIPRHRCARQALADYLEKERPRDAGDGAPALFLSATGIPARRPDGRLSLRAVNLILEQIGRWHDAELKDPTRHLSPLRPHDLRHTFAFHLAQATGADAYELERRLGHRSQRYIQRYTNPPEEVAAAYVEEF